MMQHELKIWPENFRPVVQGDNTVQIRKHDRKYAVGDTLYLREWMPKTERYTGHDCLVDVIAVFTDKTPGIKKGYCVLSIKQRVGYVKDFKPQKAGKKR